MKEYDVVFVTPGSFVIPSGNSSSVELVVEQVARRLRGHVRLAVIGRRSRRLRSTEIRQGVLYERVPAVSPRRYVEGVSRKLRKLRPKVIQVENRPRFARFLKRKHPGAQVWLSLHSVTFVSKPHIRRPELRRCLAAADRIVVNSHYLKNEMVRRDPRVKAKIVVNHLGVDPDRFISRWSPEGAAKREALLRRLGLQGRKIILYVGRLIPIKGVHHLLAAMPEIAGKVPEALLLVVGGAFYGSKRLTPYVRRLRRTSKPLRKHVRFVPYVPHGEVDEWFRLADVLVVPSARREAFGLVNVEAMAAGVPVIATRAGGMPEIVEEGVTGLTVEPDALGSGLAPAVISLLQNEAEVRRMGEKSVERVQRLFTWERMAERWLKLYNGR
ncbi:glycosyltransferase family 4 protein [Paenibacillus ehimensis]|uniref:Glycosyltransferase family 4 protein n=1 Tax=Paenibacillus ehimensis TaxID=79264 RepID=A0ABT8V652_9BACL|nr:glycosyltransferase family 4 protein [Paenibacillus ehimensis]MDO3675994.1 glycosyltransferase family 4 protein [Paenibacillus ehimensis]MEC0211163.1 glycosyltransferase family 4 protein [Paenibacillus ehimensis]